MPESVEYYLSKGFDKKAAVYFSKGRRKPVKVVPQNCFNLLITFDNNEVRLLDISPLIKEGTVYYTLKNPSIFTKCYIDQNHSICWDKNQEIDSEKVWSNKIDIGSDTCYLESVEIQKNF